MPEKKNATKPIADRKNPDITNPTKKVASVAPPQASPTTGGGNFFDGVGSFMKKLAVPLGMLVPGFAEGYADRQTFEEQLGLNRKQAETNDRRNMVDLVGKYADFIESLKYLSPEARAEAVAALGKAGGTVGLDMSQFTGEKFSAPAQQQATVTQSENSLQGKIIDANAKLAAEDEKTRRERLKWKQKADLEDKKFINQYRLELSKSLGGSGKKGSSGSFANYVGGTIETYTDAFGAATTPEALDTAAEQYTIEMGSKAAAYLADHPEKAADVTKFMETTAKMIAEQKARQLKRLGIIPGAEAKERDRKTVYHYLYNLLKANPITGPALVFGEAADRIAHGPGGDATQGTLQNRIEQAKSRFIGNRGAGSKFINNKK